MNLRFNLTVLGAALLVAVLFLAVAWRIQAPTDAAPEEDRRASASPADRDDENAPPAAAPGPARRVLAAWDRRRAAAYESGDVAALRALYAPGSRAGRADVRLLRRYRSRGLVVRHLRTQVLEFAVLRSAPGRLVLRVVDRISGARAVAESGRSHPLPRDRADRRRVVLVHRGAGWQVRTVR